MILAENPACNPLCGVCHYKKLDYSAQLARKESWAQSQLVPWRQVLQPILPAPEAERIAYRAKSWMRSDYQEGELSFGMFRAVPGKDGWGKEFISWDSCPLHVRPIQEMIGKLKSALMREVPAFVEQSLLGLWFGNPHLVIVAKDLRLEEMRKLDWSRILAAPFDRVWFHRTNQVGRTVFQHREFHPIMGPARTASDYPILAFRQIAQTLVTEARQQAVRALLLPKPASVVDLYCGTGEISRYLPADVGWLGVELSVEAVNFANQLRAQSRAPHRAYVGTVEQRLQDPKVLGEISGSYSLYLNPPRPGLGPEGQEAVRALIREKAPAAVVYLSCSASSLAKDIKILEGVGYRVGSLQPFDFFPQTEHFETLAILGRANGAV